MDFLYNDSSINNDDTQEFQQREHENKHYSLNIFAIICACISLFYATSYYFRNFTDTAIVSSVMVLLFGGVYVSSKFKLIKYSSASYTLTASVGLLMLSMFVTGGPTGYDAFWYFMFPALTLFLLGLRAGSIVAISLLALTIVISFSDNIPRVVGYYTIDFKVLFFLAYIGVFALSYTYEYLRTETRKQILRAISQSLKNERATNAKSEFIVELSHQIRTPLSSIMGITNIMKQGHVSEEQKDYIEAINTSVLNVSHVLNNLMNISEIKTDGEFDSILSFDINEVLRRAISSFSGDSSKMLGRTSFNVSEYVPSKLTGNSKKIEQLLVKIFETIVEHSRRGEASFDVFVNNKKETVNAIELMVEIHSTSLKTETENVDEVIDYSSQDNETSNVLHSVLSSHVDIIDMEDAKKIVESFGGTIGFKKIDSNINVFWFTILLWKSKNSEKAADIQKKLKNLRQTNYMAESSVLIVEDNLMNQRVLSIALRSKVKKVEIANNGKEALKLLEHSRFDIILMDIQMPILDGFKTTTKIKELEVGTDIHTPIIALTANTVSGTKEKCLAYGMDDYVSKPFQIDMLVEKIEFHLAKNKKSE